MSELAHYQQGESDSISPEQIDLVYQVCETAEGGEQDRLAGLMREQWKLMMVWRAGERMMLRNQIMGVWTTLRLWQVLSPVEVGKLYEENPWCLPEEFDGGPEQFITHAYDIQWVTARNWRRVAEAFYVKQIPKREIELLDKAGEPTGEVLEVDTTQIAPSKLQLFAAKQAAGEMTEGDWGVLANPENTWADVREYLVVVTRGERPMDDKVLLLRAGVLYVKNGESEAVPFGALEVDTSDELANWAIDTLVRRAGVKVR